MKYIIISIYDTFYSIIYYKHTPNKKYAGKTALSLVEVTTKTLQI